MSARAFRCATLVSGEARLLLVPSQQITRFRGIERFLYFASMARVSPQSAALQHSAHRQSRFVILHPPQIGGFMKPSLSATCVVVLFSAPAFSQKLPVSVR